LGLKPVLAGNPAFAALNPIALRQGDRLSVSIRGDHNLVNMMQPDMANVTERRSKYVERLRVIVTELAKDHP
jgi:hypothetical protein